jgi:putative peptidoglycan lipid II flippase
LICETDFADQAMAAMLGPGSVSVLNYGKRFISVPLSLSAIALGTAVIPYFSSMVARQGWAAVQHTFKRYYLLIFVVSIPATLILIILSQPLVVHLYRQGSFQASDTLLVAGIRSGMPSRYLGKSSGKPLEFTLSGEDITRPCCRNRP